jgi:hypothetical protein
MPFIVACPVIAFLRGEGNCEGEEQAVQAVISLERLVVDRLSPPTGG